MIPLGLLALKESNMLSAISKVDKDVYQLLAISDPMLSVSHMIKGLTGYTNDTQVMCHNFYTFNILNILKKRIQESDCSSEYIP